jgi:arylsulfatase A-like enzyme
MITSDLGEVMGEHRAYFEHARHLYREVLRVPLIIKDYARDEGRTISWPASHVDLRPTIPAFLGVEDPEWVEGIDLLAAADAGGPGKRNLFAEGWTRNERMVRSGRFKLIFDVWDKSPTVELYDLPADPDETVDLSRRRPEVVECLRGDLESHLREVAVAVNVDPGVPDAVAQDVKENLEALGYVVE